MNDKIIVSSKERFRHHGIETDHGTPDDPDFIATLKKLKDLVIRPAPTSAWDTFTKVGTTIVAGVTAAIVAAKAIQKPPAEGATEVLDSVSDELGITNKSTDGSVAAPSNPEDTTAEPPVPAAQDKPAELSKEHTEFAKKITPKVEKVIRNEPIAPPRSAAGAPARSDTAVPERTIVPPGGKDVGFVSRSFESKGNAATVSSGIGDAGGVSYGTYQLSSRKGNNGLSPVDEFLVQSAYKDKFKGLAAGSSAFSKVWTSLGSTPEFAQEQQSYIKRKYYDQVLRSSVSKSARLEKRGAAIQEMVFSTSVQYGATGAREVFEAAGISGAMSDKEIIKRVQKAKQVRLDEKDQKKKRNYKSVSGRIATEEKVLTTIAEAEAPQTKVATESVVVPSQAVVPTSYSMPEKIEPTVQPEQIVVPRQTQQSTPQKSKRGVEAAQPTNQGVPFRMRSGALGVIN